MLRITTNMCLPADVLAIPYLWHERRLSACAQAYVFFICVRACRKIDSACGSIYCSDDSKIITISDANLSNGTSFTRTRSSLNGVYFPLSPSLL